MDTKVRLLAIVVFVAWVTLALLCAWAFLEYQGGGGDLPPQEEVFPL